MIKKAIILLGFLLFSVTIFGQKSIIDTFLEQNPDIKERATTCINIAPDILCTCYDYKSFLSCPERYQSLSVCDANLAIPRFEEMMKSKNFNEIKSSSDEETVIKYFQKKGDRRGGESNEIIVYVKYHDDLTALYLKGVNLSPEDFEDHISRIRECIEKKEYSDKNLKQK